MNLDLANDLFKKVKDNKVIQDFMDELKNRLNGNSNILTTEYRDKLLLEREKILNNYASKTKEKGEMYYIYDVNSEKTNTYNACVCGPINSHEVIELPKKNLPENANVGSVLRNVNGNFVLDEEATAIVSSKIDDAKNKLLNEQETFLESQRIENHKYEVSEKDENSIWLFDLTNNSEEAFEEIKVSNGLLKDLKEGDILVYKNGEYTL